MTELEIVLRTLRKSLRQDLKALMEEFSEYPNASEEVRRLMKVAADGAVRSAMFTVDKAFSEILGEK